MHLCASAIPARACAPSCTARASGGGSGARTKGLVACQPPSRQRLVAVARPARVRARAAPSRGPGGSGPDPSDNSNNSPREQHQQQQQEEHQPGELGAAALRAPSPAAPQSADLGIEAMVDAVKAAGHGTSVVLLRLLDGTARVLPIFIGEVEASALSRALAAGRAAASAASTAAAAAALGASSASSPSSPSSSPYAAAAAARPQTYDLLKSAVHAMGRSIAHVRVTDLKHNTYYASLGLQQQQQQQQPADGADANAPSAPQAPPPLIELDARPSDALNLAVRCGCAVYVARPVAERCAQPEALLPPELQTTPPPPPPPPHQSLLPSSSSSSHQQQQRSPSPSSSSSRQHASSSSSSALHNHNHHHHAESHAEIVRTARAALASYRDPTPMLALARDVAAAQERFEAAAEAQAALARCVTRDGALRLAAAVEAALADGRYAEAARLRDELLRAVDEAASAAPAEDAEAGGGR